MLEGFWGMVVSAGDKQLRKGPRGGGRSVEGIVEHIIESHYGYLWMIYWREPREKKQDVPGVLKAVKHDDAQALAFAISDKMPEAGSRGGALWKPRYFVRRAAWHLLDHTWEIEDKVEP